jgi:hypothetical protein
VLSLGLERCILLLLLLLLLLLTLQIELAFINTIRPKACGSCGSLLDAICLVKA